MYRSVIVDICHTPEQEAQLIAMRKNDGWTLSRALSGINAIDGFLDTGDDPLTECSHRDNEGKLTLLVWRIDT